MKLSQAANTTNGHLIGCDVEFNFVSTDTRQIKPGSLFIALKGPHFDGHDFIRNAVEKGAVAALVNHKIDHSPVPLIQVNDTHSALGQLAHYHRQQFSIPVIAITGSCGKTTTKAFIAAILNECGETLATEGTLNNDIGVPLTLFRLTPEHQYAVIEMGTNHFGEISYITQIAQPTVAMIINAAPAHLEGFIDVQGVARAKGEIFCGLKQNGIAIINADDDYANYWQSLIKTHKIIRFGIKSPAQIHAKQVVLDTKGRAQFILCTPDGEIDVHLAVLGMHNVMNALAAASAAWAVGAPLAAISRGLESTLAVNKRLVEQKGYNSALIIDDTYNANPLSFQAALEILAQKQGKKILVFGDMGELGESTEYYHRKLGENARLLQIDQLYGYGNYSQLTVESFGMNAHHYCDQNKLILAVRAQMDEGVTLLVKGSRAMQMEHIVEALL